MKSSRASLLRGWQPMKHRFLLATLAAYHRTGNRSLSRAATARACGPAPVVVATAPIRRTRRTCTRSRDLRAARGYLARPAGVQVKWDENRAIRRDRRRDQRDQARVDRRRQDPRRSPDGRRLHGVGRSPAEGARARRDRACRRQPGRGQRVRRRPARIARSATSIRAANAINEGMTDAGSARRRRRRRRPLARRRSTPRTSTRSPICALRAVLSRPAGRAIVKWDENRAIREIDAAIHEIKKASIDDGKNVEDHPPVDAAMVGVAACRSALELGRDRARRRQQEEDNGFAQRPQERAIGHMRSARSRAIHDGMAEARRRRRRSPSSPRRRPAGAHPAYLHAMSAISATRVRLLERPAEPDVKWDENNAIREVDAAINEIKAPRSTTASRFGSPADRCAPRSPRSPEARGGDAPPGRRDIESARTTRGPRASAVARSVTSATPSTPSTKRWRTAGTELDARSLGIGAAAVHRGRRAASRGFGASRRRLRCRRSRVRERVDHGIGEQLGGLRAMHAPARCERRVRVDAGRNRRAADRRARARRAARTASRARAGADATASDASTVEISGDFAPGSRS